MRNLRRMIGAAAIATAAAANAANAQPPTTSTPTTSTPTSSTTNNLGSSNIGTTTLPGASSNVAGNLASDTLNQQLASALLAPSKANMTSTLAAANQLGIYYGSVLYQGSKAANVPNGGPGGFGAVTYPATGGTGRGAQTGPQGGQGRGAAGGANSADPGGQIVALPRQIAYSSQIQFKLPPGNPVPQLLSDLRGSIDRVPTPLLANPGGVIVEVNGRDVVLRGAVKDEDEFRLVEGLIRLTPGVYGIKNELTFTK